MLVCCAIYSPPGLMGFLASGRSSAHITAFSILYHNQVLCWCQNHYVVFLPSFLMSDSSLSIGWILVAPIMFTLKLVWSLVGKSGKLTHKLSFQHWVLSSEHASSSLCKVADIRERPRRLFCFLFFLGAEKLVRCSEIKKKKISI